MKSIFGRLTSRVFSRLLVLIALLTFLPVGFISSGAFAQDAVEGIVTDIDTGLLIEGVEVFQQSNNILAVTDVTDITLRRICRD